MTSLQLLYFSASLGGGVLLVLLLFRCRDRRMMARQWRHVYRRGDGKPFEPAMVEELPAPAARLLRRAIAPGTPLAASVELRMDGGIGLRPNAAKRPFHAREVLSGAGLVWRARTGGGLFRVSGEDYFAGTRGAMHWYAWGVLPLVRAHGPHVSRSAAGRVALEAAALLPPLLLPRAGARWEAVDEQAARAYLTVGGEQSSLLLVVDEEGRLQRIEMQRWDSEGLSGEPEYVPWVVDGFDEERRFGGYTIPTRMRVTRRAGTSRADNFFEATILDADYH